MPLEIRYTAHGLPKGTQEVTTFSATLVKRIKIAIWIAPLQGFSGLMKPMDARKQNRFIVVL